MKMTYPLGQKMVRNLYFMCYCFIIEIDFFIIEINYINTLKIIICIIIA